MDTFHPDVTCPKCGSNDNLRVEWWPAEPESERVPFVGFPSVYNFMPVEQVPDERKETVPAKPERMEIICRRCAYEWQMAPMTSEPTAVTARGQ